MAKHTRIPVGETPAGAEKTVVGGDTGNGKKQAKNGKKNLKPAASAIKK